MSKFSNLLRLLILLKSKKRMKTKELAEALEVSERMVRKYMVDLAEANIKIDSIPGPTGGYELKGDDYLLNLDISKEEAVALQLASTELKNHSNFSMINPLQSLVDKIKVVDNCRYKYEDYSDNTVISPKILNAEKENKFELEIQAAIIMNKKLKISYDSASSGPSSRIVRPYSIITRNSQKYLIGYCEKKEKILIFKLIRIEMAEILDEKFTIPQEFNSKDFMKNHLGLFNEETIHLSLLINKPFSKSVSEAIYADNQVITENEDGSILFEGTMMGKTDIIRWILSMRTAVTILEPNELKQEVKEELKNMLNTI